MTEESKARLRYVDRFSSPVEEREGYELVKRIFGVLYERGAETSGEIDADVVAGI